MADVDSRAPRRLPVTKVPRWLHPGIRGSWTHCLWHRRSGALTSWGEARWPAVGAPRHQKVQPCGSEPPTIWFTRSTSRRWSEASAQEQPECQGVRALRWFRQVQVLLSHGRFLKTRQAMFFTDSLHKPLLCESSAGILWTMHGGPANVLRVPHMDRHSLNKAWQTQCAVDWKWNWGD